MTEDTSPVLSHYLSPVAIHKETKRKEKSQATHPDAAGRVLGTQLTGRTQDLLRARVHLGH